MSERTLWVVEMLCEHSTIPARWEPTGGAGITRDDARYERDLWKKNNPADAFRVRAYVPREGR